MVTGLGAAQAQLQGGAAGAVPRLTDYSNEGVSSEMLVDVAAQDTTPGMQPTALRYAASAFLRSDSRRHVIGLCYLSRGSLQEKSGGNIDSGGTTYYFKNPNSTFWYSDFDSIFSST